MRKREEIANHIITKIDPAWIEHLKSTHPDKIVDIERLHFANHCIEFTKMRNIAATSDNGRYFFDQNLVTVHFPKGSHFLEDKSYRVLSSTSDGTIGVCDDYTCTTYDVEVDMLTADAAEVTKLWPTSPA